MQNFKLSGTNALNNSSPEFSHSFSSLFQSPDCETNSTKNGPTVVSEPALFPVLTQDEKRERRRVARAQKKEKRDNDLYLKKLEKIRQPNPGNVTVINDAKLMTAYRNAIEEKKPVKTVSQKKSKQPIEVRIDDLLAEPKPIGTQAKTKGKVTKFGVVDSLIHRSKGKKREIPKKKLTRLKKAILKIRQGIREPTTNEEVPAVERISLDVPRVDIKHSRNFRPYCNHFTTLEICSLTEQLLEKLFLFQERAHDLNKIKASANRRYTVGLHEVTKLLAAKQIKLILIAPDMEPNKGDGGLDATVEEIKQMAKIQQVPYIFALKRRKIGYLLHKHVPVCCVGVMSYQGCEQIVQELLELVHVERDKYTEASLQS